METGPRDDTPSTWVGRASARPPADPWPTAEQPVVPPRFAPPPQVVYVEVPRRGRGGLFALGVLAAFVAGGATLALIVSPALRGMVGMDAPSSTAPPSPTAPPTPTTPPPPGLGDPVRDGTLEFVVARVTCDVPQVGSGILVERAQGQFCLVDITAKNIGCIPAIFSDEAQTVHTTEGTSHGAKSWPGFLVNNLDLGRYWVNPDSTMTATLVFDIPATATVVTIELHDSHFSDGITVTL